MSEILLVVILFVLLVGAYLVLYMMNQKIDIPEECKELFEENEKCAQCSISTCNFKKGIKKEE